MKRITPMRRTTFSVFTISLLLFSCSNTDSNNINTAGIYADFEVTNKGSQSDIVAQLKVGDAWSNTVLELSRGDQLIAYNGSASVVMTKGDSILGDIKYHASFINDLGGTQYTITLNRPTTNEVINSSATLPNDFTITLSGSDPYTSADSIEITWNPASASLKTYISLIGICGSYLTSIEPNTNSINIPLDSVTKSDLSDPNNCLLSVAVSRFNKIPVNAQYGEGGYFIATQTRSTSIQFTY